MMQAPTQNKTFQASPITEGEMSPQMLERLALEESQSRPKSTAVQLSVLSTPPPNMMPAKKLATDKSGDTYLPVTVVLPSKNSTTEAQTKEQTEAARKQAVMYATIIAIVVVMILLAVLLRKKR